MLSAVSERLVCLDDYEKRARELLAEPVFDYIHGAAGDERTRERNRQTLDNLLLHSRILIDASKVDPSIDLFGLRLPFPVLLAPTAFHRVFHPEGERATLAGARAAETLFVLSTSTTTPIEDLDLQPEDPWWFQLYVQSDRGFVRDLVAKAEAHGCRAICVTVDNAVSGPRNRQERSGFVIPEGLDPPYLKDLVERESVNRYHCPVLTWADLEWLRSLTSLPLLLKGVMHPDDADRAVGEGVDGILCSNHGGRNLDSQAGAIEALPEVIEAVGGKVPVLMDGGIRRGTDVVKALAFGAGAVLIGRPYLYGLSVDGAKGVTDVINLLRRELEMAMALTGCLEVSDIDRRVIRKILP